MYSNFFSYSGPPQLKAVPNLRPFLLFCPSTLNCNLLFKISAAVPWTGVLWRAACDCQYRPH